ncbi:MAG: hypothetical protein BGP11_08535 [Rhodobacterales bacterium 65-51]|uniref:phage head spike fiber domain-containing protein n=1 Tax=uncultured Gemmobacter sp. TaxID=1095917 RepID=UPI0009609D4C|nr:hypothetical protein [uncultured Gemmobacter sp.]OJY34653.1 MAG: hypothetical protein BGP11_08535 [Rhodobacterales bacterium 65-51]
MVETVAGWLVTAGFSQAVATGIAQIGTSILLSTVSLALAKRPSMGDQSRELEVTRSLPVYRTAYGEARIVGSWAPGWVVNDGILYACIILNSRPSDSVSAIEFDNRLVEFSGDMLDFSTGATAINDPFDGYMTAWLGLGDQTAPPDLIMSEWGDAGSSDNAKFWPTDVWAGRTVLWLRLKKGSAKSAGERWPQGRPQVHVTGKWSKVWNPDDIAQDPDDPATWEWSDNQGLCLLDALRTNPIAKLPTSLIHMASINRQVEVADELVLRKGGLESDPRYRVGGVIVWNPQSELYQLLRPLEVAGGGGLVQIGGMIGYQPGEYLAPSADITDVLDEAPVSFTAISRGRDMPRAIRAIYPEPGAAWEDTTLTPIEVPGGGGWDGGDDRVEDLELSLVPYARQANRLAQIEARMRGQQKRIGGILFPRHLDLVAGANITMDLPRATDPRNGVYQITRIHPAHFLDAGDGVAFRLPFEASGIASSVYAWNPETDEQDYAVAVDIDASLTLAPPGDILTTSGADVVVETWGGYVARVLFEFAPSPSSGVMAYEWQWRETGGDWTDGGMIDADVRNADDRVFAYLDYVSDTRTYEIRVRAMSAGRTSDWVTETAIVVTTGVPRYRADFEDALYEIDRTAVPQATAFGLTRASTATYIDGSGVLQTAAADVARFDYSTGVRALLAEPAATNMTPYSRYSASNWTLSGASVGAATRSALDGATITAFLASGSAVTHRVIRALTDAVAAHAIYTMSFDVARPAGSDTAYLWVRMRHTTGGQTVRIYLAGGVPTYSSTAPFGTNPPAAIGSSDVSAREVATGLYRITLTGEISPVASNWTQWDMGWSVSTTENVAGTANTTLFIDRVQIEAGADETSYIPTSATSAARAADIPELRGLTATLDLAVTYGDGSTETLADQAVSPGVWPALSQNSIRRIVGTP